MAITYAQLITDALREINVISEVGTLSSEQGSENLRQVNQLMEVWREEGIDFGYYAHSSTTDNIPIPDWAERAVTLALAQAAASRYGVSMSPELIIAADQAKTMVQRKAINEALKNTDMSHLPIGQGHYGDGFYNINTDN